MVVPVAMRLHSCWVRADRAVASAASLSMRALPAVHGVIPPRNRVYVILVLCTGWQGCRLPGLKPWLQCVLTAAPHRILWQLACSCLLHSHCVTLCLSCAGWPCSGLPARSRHKGMSYTV